ncbi:MAG: sigma-70 family RNA polymerase sigma factor [Firmicutes bacterium]|nr:sigma-70 family RNA polymerase sigma factor [Bacillota bacterium]
MYLRQKRKSRNEVFLHDPVGQDRDGNEIALIDVLEDGSEPVIDIIANRWSAGRVKALLESLGPRERQVLELRYGLRGGERLTQRQVARQLGISRSYVSRLEKRAVRQVRQAWQAMQHGDPRTAGRARGKAQSGRSGGGGEPGSPSGAGRPDGERGGR